MLYSKDSFTGLFNHSEAQNHEVGQLCPSGCGVTAVINVLLVSKAITKEDIQKLLQLDECFILRRRDNFAPLDRYLLSRSVAGCTGEEIVSSLFSIVKHLSTKVTFLGYFLPYERIKLISGGLIEVIAEKMREGYVCVATFNLQLFGNDAWHHQMIYGVDESSRMIHAMNPIGPYPEHVATQLLATESVLLVRRDDILKRLQSALHCSMPSADIDNIAIHRTSGVDNAADTPPALVLASSLVTLAGSSGSTALDSTLYDQEQWRQLLVREQLAKIVAEEQGIEKRQTDSPRLTHVCIPANYVAGLSFFRRVTDD
jgi:hypothetical protein